MTAMTRTLAAGLLLAGLLAAGRSHAETRTLGGAQLVFTDTLSDDVVIATDPSLKGEIRLTRDEGRGLACLTLAGGATAVVSTSRCHGDVEHLRIDVSPDTAVTLTATGEGDVRVADLRAPLVVSLAGSGDLLAGRTGALAVVIHHDGNATFGEVDGPATVEIGSSGDVRINKVLGPLTAKLIGSGDLVVGEIQAASMVLDASGSGDTYVGGGHIEALRANLLGSGDLSVAAAVHNADVDARGSADVKLPAVAGTLNRNVGTGSDVVVLSADQAARISDTVSRKLGHRRSGTGAHFPGSSAFGHLLTAVFAGLVLYICWRVVRRAGGLGGRRRNAAPAASSNPGVLALGETMSRLEGRLGRLESYVTTREFDLTRKFRELGPR